MITDLFLALGLALSPASQLRFAGLPLGPGELCLVLWLLLMPLQRLQAGKIVSTLPLRQLLGYWTLFGMSLAIGYIAAAVIGDSQDTKLVLHDAIAFPLLAAVSIASAVDPGAQIRLRRVAWLCAGIGTACLLMQCFNAVNLFNLFAFDTWYWDRLRGWSQNPNQLAFFCLFLTLLSLHLMEQASNPIGRVAALVCLVTAGVVGYLTKSDTFRVAFAVGLLIFIMIKSQVQLSRRGSDEHFLGPVLAWYGVICLPLALLAVLMLLPQSTRQAAQSVLWLAKDGGQQAASEADLRYTLWQEALDRGLESGLLGLGPGPHLPIPPSIIAARQSEIEPDNLEHPQLNGTANFEAHNTYLDLLTQGGLLAVANFMWLAFSALAQTYRTRLAGLSALLVGLGVFAMTGFIARQPVFWLAISLSLVSTGRNANGLESQIGG